MATKTATEFAQEVGTDSKTVRRFLRAVTPKDEQPGKGNRWAIEGKQVRSLKKQYKEWAANQRKAEEVEDNDEVAENLVQELDMTDEVNDEEPDLVSFDPSEEDLEVVDLDD